MSNENSSAFINCLSSPPIFCGCQFARRRDFQVVLVPSNQISSHYYEGVASDRENSISAVQKIIVPGPRKGFPLQAVQSFSSGTVDDVGLQPIFEFIGGLSFSGAVQHHA